jgi:hypothetical protein
MGFFHILQWQKEDTRKKKFMLNSACKNVGVVRRALVPSPFAKCFPIWSSI